MALKSNSEQEKVANMQAAATTIAPPRHVHLRPGDLPFWLSITRARHASTWNNSDLEVAANLARCKADIERIQRELDEEGDTVTNARGTVVMNPKHSLLETLSRRATSLSRMLHVHAEATVGQSQACTKKAMASHEAQTAADDASSPLIPGLGPRLVSG